MASMAMCKILYESEVEGEISSVANYSGDDGTILIVIEVGAVSCLRSKEFCTTTSMTWGGKK